MSLSVVLFLLFSVPAINAFPKPELDLPCVPNELFDVCGENMQCEKIGDSFLCRCVAGFDSKEKQCEGKTMWNFQRRSLFVCCHVINGGRGNAISSPGYSRLSTRWSLADESPEFNK